MNETSLVQKIQNLEREEHKQETRKSEDLEPSLAWTSPEVRLLAWACYVMNAKKWDLSGFGFQDLRERNGNGGSAPFWDPILVGR